MAEPDRINLRTKDSISDPYMAGSGQTNAAIQVVATAWSTAVVSLYWSATLGEHESWILYSPTLEFSTSTTGRQRVYLPAKGAIRLQTTTAAATADANAKVIVEMS